MSGTGEGLVEFGANLRSGIVGRCGGRKGPRHNDAGAEVFLEGADTD